MIIGRVKMALFAVAGSAFIGMAALLWWLHENNQSLIAEQQRLQQTNAALADSAKNQKAMADSLGADLKALDDLASQAIQASKHADQKLQQARQALHDALQDDVCAGTAHPPALGDWLREDSDGL